MVGMDKKLLICGSAIAVVVLVLASLSPVVGYNSVKSSVINSPLFNIRIKRAINEESNDLACNYFGKGKACTLSIPKRNNQIETALKVIDSIAKMDDETFEKFIVLLIRHVQKDNRFNDIKSGEIREALYLIRNNDKSIPLFQAITKNKYNTADTCHYCDFTSKPPICTILLLLLLLYMAFIVTMGWLVLFITVLLNCFDTDSSG